MERFTTLFHEYSVLLRLAISSPGTFFVLAFAKLDFTETPFIERGVVDSKVRRIPRRMSGGSDRLHS